jgi:hypothetical protein
MADEKEKAPKIEPRWHKHSTLRALREKRVEIRKAEVAEKEAEDRVTALRNEARFLELEAAEWMKRDKTRTEVALYPDRVTVGERQVAVVFTLNDYGNVYDTAVEVVR